jgi:hypothetical protein
MPRIEVDTGQLQGASSHQSALGAEIASLCGPLEAAGSSAAGAAGDGAAGGAIADFASTWSLSLRMLAQSVGGLATNVGAAGSAYAGTDASAMAGPGL